MTIEQKAEEYATKKAWLDSTIWRELVAAYIAGSKENNGLRWVTDGSLPTIKKEYFIRGVHDNSLPDLDDPIMDSAEFNPKTKKWDVGKGWNVIAWLDESNPSSIEQEKDKRIVDLEAEVLKWHGEYVKSVGKNTTLEQENQELRAALKELVELEKVLKLLVQVLGTVNFSSHTQMKQAIEESLELCYSTIEANH